MPQYSSFIEGVVAGLPYMRARRMSSREVGYTRTVPYICALTKFPRVVELALARGGVFSDERPTWTPPSHDDSISYALC
jgi:hypothetical protein